MSRYHMAAGYPDPHCVSLSVLSAVRIALRYGRTPTVSQLMNDYGMSRATAYRWRAAFKIARGEP